MPTKLPLKDRHLAKEALDERLVEALRLARANEKKSRKKLEQKRLSVDELMTYIEQPLLKIEYLRPLESFNSQRIDKGQRVRSLVDHLFVVYPLPLYLYQVALTPNGQEHFFGRVIRKFPSPHWHLDLFLNVAQGRSISHIVGKRLTRRAEHFLLQAPGKHSVGQNLLWSQCRAEGLPPNVCQVLVERLATMLRTPAISSKKAEILNFVRKFHDQMVEGELIDLLDFILVQMQNPDFSLKGRTVRSLRALEGERTIWNIRNRDVPYFSWRGRYSPWIFKIEFETVMAIELTTSRAVAEEGKKQRHCVRFYSRSCEQGRIRIMSFRWMRVSGGGETVITKRLTAEVSNRGEVLQLKGQYNRIPTQDEREIVEKWARDNH